MVTDGMQQLDLSKRGRRGGPTMAAHSRDRDPGSKKSQQRLVELESISTHSPPFSQMGFEAGKTVSSLGARGLALLTVECFSNTKTPSFVVTS